MCYRYQQCCVYQRRPVRGRRRHGTHARNAVAVLYIGGVRKRVCEINFVKQIFGEYLYYFYSN